MSYFYKENPVLEGLIDSYFESIDRYSRENANGKLSVILLGSLSRGEGTWLETENGFKMISDIEYFTVYPEGFTAFNEYTDFCDKKAKEIFSSQTSVLFHIDNSFICREQMKFLERKLLTYDAKVMGKSVAGQNDMGLLPEISLENINLWDIKDVLTHRVFSALYYGIPLKNSGNTVEYRYNLSKNSLDLMTVMLVNHGKLESGFIRRLEVIKTLPVSDEIKNYFEFCLSIKLSSDCRYSFETEEMEKMFVYLLCSLQKDFRLPFKNLAVNAKVVTRRVMGIIKRAIIYRGIPSFSHFKGLVSAFEKGEVLSESQKKSNLILNGYPTEI